MHLLASTSSTNDEAKQAARGGAPHGATWVAERQTAGRGRQGRTWQSPGGENLLFSVLWRRTVSPSRLPQLALAAGLAVHGVVTRAVSPHKAQIKWPNDVVVAGRKVAGILVEAITHGGGVEAVVVGVGINVHTRSFPDEIAGRASSIALLAREVPDRAILLVEVLAELDAELQTVARHGLEPDRARLQGADALHGRRVRSDAGDEGTASGIDDDGRLIVTRDDGVVTHWSAGEVHLAS